MSKTLLIVRHAHREKAQGLDNGLSEKGAKQARRVSRQLLRLHENEEMIFLSSPKKRCLETLAPISKAAGKKVIIEPLLDERNFSETQSVFQTRLAFFFEGWRKSTAPLTVICSHGDWIPEFSKLLLKYPVDLQKGGWLQIEGQGSYLSLTWIVQGKI